METPPPLTPPALGVDQPTMSLAARLFNVFAAPGETFDAVKASGGSVAHWLLPAALLAVIGWIGVAVVLTQPTFQQQIDDMAGKALDKQVQAGKMPQAAADSARKIAQISIKVSMIAGPAVAALLLPFWWGLILWLLGAKIMKGGFGYMQAVEVAGLANMILVLEAIVRTLLVFVTNSLYASPSLVLFVKDYDPQKPAHALLGLTNVMLFWVLAVRGIGLARLANISAAKACAWVIGIWVTYTGLLMGLGFALNAAFKR